MSELTTATAMMLSALHDPEGEFDAVLERREAMFAAFEGAEPEEIAEAIASLAGSVRDPQLALGRGGVAAITGGALVESGAPTGELGAAILERLPALLRAVTGFEAACLATLPPEEEQEEPAGSEDDAEEAFEGEPGYDPDLGDGAGPVGPEALMMGGREVPIEVAREVAQTHPDGAVAWESMEHWCLPAIACLTRDAALRASARADQALQQQALETLGYDDFLVVALQLLDDEPLLVLSPATQQGFEMTISGVADNFQLNTLLADALIREGSQGPEWGLPGERPAPEAVADATGEGEPAEVSCVGQWNLHGWRALAADGTLPEDGPSDHWIWNEGRPADIEPFEGRRVIVIGPAPYERSWRAARSFSGLAASLELTRQLEPAEVADWLQRLGAAAAA